VLQKGALWHHTDMLMQLQIIVGERMSAQETVEMGFAHNITAGSQD